MIKETIKSKIDRITKCIDKMNNAFSISSETNDVIYKSFFISKSLTSEINILKDVREDIKNLLNELEVKI